MICEACIRGCHEHCGAQVRAANAPCGCEHCWGIGGSELAYKRWEEVIKRCKEEAKSKGALAMETDDALYQAICKEPYDDTARLVYADYLDETEIPENAVRAEYIRLSIACEHPPLKASFVDMANWENNRKRAKQILTENYDKWTVLKCEMCDGKGIAMCMYCGTSRNAYKCLRETGRIHDSVNVEPSPRGVTYHKGFPVDITCQMQELFIRGASREATGNPIVKEWAKTIVRRTPITMFKPLDYRPHLVLGRPIQSRNIHQYIWTDTVVRNGIYPYSLPTWLFNMVWELAPKYADTGCKESHSQVMGSRIVVCTSSEQAYEILSTVIGNVIRQDVYGNAP